MALKSKCCKSKVKTNMSPDFINDNPKTQKIGTCYYICMKCGEACNVFSVERKKWKINPNEQVIPDKRKKIKNNIIKKEMESL